MRIWLFDSYTKSMNTPEQKRLLDGVVECGGSISHVATGVQWHVRGQGYDAYAVFDCDEDAIAFKLKYL